MRDIVETPVLITGATGWLGQALVHALIEGIDDVPDLPRAGAEVRALVAPDDPGAANLPAGLAAVSGDLRDRAAAERFVDGAGGATLFHVAGVIHPRRVAEFDAVNVDGTVNVLEAAAAAGVARAVVMSSNSPLGCNPHPDHRFDESSPYRPYMGYGRSKMRMERAVAAIASRTGLETVVVRAPWFYGPHQPPRQTLFFRMIRDGGAPIVGGGDGLRSMAYVDNLCQGLLLAATVPRAAGETYWIADEHPYTMNRIVDTVERLLADEFGIACRGGRLRLPGIAAEIAGLADAALQRAGVYHQKIHVLSEMNKTIACTIEKAREQLGYAPTVALEEGMRRSIRWLLAERGGLGDA